MDIRKNHKDAHKYLWRRANIRLIPSAMLAIAGAALSSFYGSARSGTLDERLIAVIGVVMFVVFAVTFLRILSGTIYRLITHYQLSPGRAAGIQFVIRILGYAAVFLTVLNLVGIPIEKLLLGGAAVGIILGVAAQQALANVFASFVLMISRPFSVGDRITINSGGLGGKYIGIIKDIGLTHTRLEQKNGSAALLPNAALLSGATIVTGKAAVKKQ